MTQEQLKELWRHKDKVILYLLTRQESVLVSGEYIGDVLALQCQGLITSEPEGGKLRVRRKEASPCPTN
jgi:hypothetical protein